MIIVLGQQWQGIGYTGYTFFVAFALCLLKIGKNVEHHLTYSLKETTAMWWSMLLCTRDAHIYCWLTVLVKNRAESGFTVSSGRTDHD